VGYWAKLQNRALPILVAALRSPPCSKLTPAPPGHVLHARLSYALGPAEDLQNLARNRRDPSFRFTGGARECEVDASQTQLDGREMPPLTEASRDATQALKKGSDANKIRKSGLDVPFDPSHHRA